jgi:hypothetical protein
MKGYHIGDCLHEQRRLNKAFFNRKRQQDDGWDEPETPPVKAARMGADREGGANEEAEAGGEEEVDEDEEEQTNKAITGVHLRQSYELLGSLLHLTCTAACTTTWFGR